MKRNVFLSILSGIALALPFMNANLGILSWCGFLPLFIALKDKTKFQAFRLAYFTGVVFWLATIYWLIHVTLTGMILLVLYLALYFGAFGLLFSAVRRMPPRLSLIFIPGLWVLLEYLRSHLLTGFPWALLGYSQYLALPLIQISDITGAWGVSFLLMLINVAIYLAFENKQRKAVVLICLLCVFLSLGYGYYKINYFSKNAGHRTVKIALVQGNIAQDLKWDTQARGFIVNRYINLTRKASRDNPDLIIWPEASLPMILEEEPFYYERIKEQVEGIKVPLLFGAVTSRDERYYNSAILLSGEEADLNLNIYDKIHLVPFGEYIPLKKIFGFLETIVPIGEITPGQEYKVFDKPAKFSVLICFEDLFPGLSRRFVRQGARFLVNITNDAWYKISSASYQHLAASVFRAVENRLPLARSANTGVSCFISSSGKITSYVQDGSGENIFVTGYSTQDISLDDGFLSFYTRQGDIFIFLLFILILYVISRFIA